MELYRAYFRILRHHLRGIIMYVLIVIGIIIIMTLQLQKVQYYYVDRMLDNYMKIWETYISQGTPKTEFDLYNRFMGDGNNAIILYTFLNYAAFSVLSLVSTGTAIMHIEFQNENISKRIKSTPIKKSKMMCSLMLANGLLAVGIWMLHMLVAVYLPGNQLFNIKGILVALNLFALAMAAMSFASLTARYCKKRSRSAITVNIITLLVCLVSGIFTPQYLMGSSSKTIAVFTPVYWYARTNSLIGEYQFTEFADYAEVIRCIGIQILFAVGMMIVAIAIDRYREREKGNMLQEW